MEYKGRIKTIDPRLVWVGVTEVGIKRVMPTPEALKWVKEGKGRTIKMIEKEVE